MKTHRIATGGIVIKEKKILLVRYMDRNKKTFLVCPGGAIKENESLMDAVYREVFEETGIKVKAEKILMVEDLITSKYRMQKTWFLCHIISGKLKRTREAIKEGIFEANWYSKDKLQYATVYPDIVKTADWSAFYAHHWKTVYNGLRYANFGIQSF